nr:hypothetical protein [Koleobacter methoxysyntrophicus]
MRICLCGQKRILAEENLILNIFTVMKLTGNYARLSNFVVRCYSGGKYGKYKGADRKHIIE